MNDPTAQPRLVLASPPRHRMRRWATQFFQNGLTPQQLALNLSVGSVLGVFPALGTTSFLCAFVASVLRLNHPAMQSINLIVYPLQFLLLIPFYRFGAVLFNDAEVRWTASEVRHLIGSGVWHAIDVLWVTTWHAIAAWALIAPAAVLLIYFPIYLVVRRLRHP